VTTASVPLISEEQWAQQVIDLAQMFGWRHYRTYDSRHSPKGFPDLVLCRPPRLVCLELKSDSKKSQPTPEQFAWIEDLAACSAGVFVAGGNLLVEYAHVVARVARPADFDEVCELLR
jgi:hypothetical protein